MKGRKLTQEQYDEAVRIAGSGGDQLAYLKKCGAKNPSATWVYIKKKEEAKIKEQVMAIPQIKVQEEKPILAEVAEKVPEVIVVPHDAIDKADNYPKKKQQAMDVEDVMEREYFEPEKGLKVKSMFSNVIKGGFFAKGERGVPMSIRTYPTMTLVAKSNPFDLDNQLKDCKLELTREEWYKLIDEIREAIDKMAI